MSFQYYEEIYYFISISNPTNKHTLNIIFITSNDPIAFRVRREKKRIALGKAYFFGKNKERIKKINALKQIVKSKIVEIWNGGRKKKNSKHRISNTTIFAIFQLILKCRRDILY